MKHEKLIVALLFVFLFALTVAAVFASRVPPHGRMMYQPGYGKPAPVQAVPMDQPPMKAVAP